MTKQTTDTGEVESACQRLNTLTRHVPDYTHDGERVASLDEAEEALITAWIKSTPPTLGELSAYDLLSIISHSKALIDAARTQGDTACRLELMSQNCMVPSGWQIDSAVSPSASVARQNDGCWVAENDGRSFSGSWLYEAIDQVESAVTPSIPPEKAHA